jgi:AraC-like DNA-binding protein
MVAGYWQAFLTELCRTACSTGLKAPPDPHPSTGRLDTVRTFIDQHFREPVSLAKLARVAGLSPTYLCRAFRTYAGKSLFTYILERRIQAAMLRLRQTDEKVIQIAHEVGFNDLSHFNRCFTRLCAHSPRAYRLNAHQGGDAGF